MGNSLQELFVGDAINLGLPVSFLYSSIISAIFLDKSKISGESQCLGRPKLGATRGWMATPCCSEVKTPEPNIECRLSKEGPPVTQTALGR